MENYANPILLTTSFLKSRYILVSLSIKKYCLDNVVDSGRAVAIGGRFLRSQDSDKAFNSSRAGQS